MLHVCNQRKLGILNSVQARAMLRAHCIRIIVKTFQIVGIGDFVWK
jgi:hypothetical protein